MSKAEIDATRRVAKAMTEEEQREVIKVIPSTMLLEELKARADLNEAKIQAASQVLNATTR